MEKGLVIIPAESTIKAEPDTVQFNITVSHTTKTYKDCVKTHIEVISSVIESLGILGIVDCEVEQCAYDVSSDYAHAVSYIRFDTDIDFDLISKIFGSVSCKDKSVQVTARFKLKDVENAEVRAMNECVNTARRRVECLTKCSGQSISPSIVSCEILESYVDDSGLVLYDSVERILTPKDVNVSMTVQFAFKLD